MGDEAMLRVGPLVHLRRVLISNVFLLDGGRGDRFLIDTGHWSERATLLLELRRAGVWPSDLTGVLLTHRHSDHAGNAGFLQRKFGVKIFAHRADAEVLEERAPRAPLGDKGPLHARFIAQFENLWPSRVRVDRALEDGDTVSSLEVHWVPGHTEGSVFFRHEGTSSLLSGDTLLTALPPMVLLSGLAGPHLTFSTDLARAHDSLLAFHRKGHAYENLLAGHGTPIIGDARRRAMRFLEKGGLG